MKRVLVAMSGGVDSSVAAALLVEQGYEVIGATMQVWDYTQCTIEEGHGTCCSSIDVDDARAVADKLKIPFYVINCEAKFKETVIDPFVKDYLKGHTPSPCVNCNTFLKFDYLYKKMKELECDYLATGHYAQVVQENGKYKLVTSTDDWKDQTYFLFTLKPEILPHLLFPVGNIKKPEVRAIAEAKNLINARKKDSVGICFVGKNDYSKFIETQVSKSILKPGFFKKYPEGEILGHHKGIHHFTYGQRRGLGMDYHETLYVLKTDAQTNTVWVGEEKFLYQEELILRDCSFLDDLPMNEAISIKIRYHHKGAVGTVSKDGTKLKVKFDQPQRAITPGQAAVFYKDKQLLGGGWIE